MVGENFNFFYFLKSFRKWGKAPYFHFKTTKIRSSLIWRKNVHICELSQKCRQVRCGWKLQFFEKSSKMKKIIIFSLQDNQDIKIHSFGWKMCTCVNWAKTVYRFACENFIFYFFIFWNVSKNEEKHHIVISGQLKYKNSLIWMKNVHICELSKKCRHVHSWRKLQIFQCVNWAKNVDRSAMGEKSSQKWRRASYFHFRTTKI